MLESTNFSVRKKKMRRIIAVLKSKIRQLEELESEIKKSEIKSKNPKSSVSMLEEIIVPPLSVLKEKEEKKVV